MATGGAFSASLSKDSEELYEFCCTPCSKDGGIVEALNQCLDCNEFYCGKCIEFHQKFGATASHKVLGQKEMRNTIRPSRTQQPSRNCQVHGGERITTYCADHGVVCCNTGVSISHKNCDGITYIADAARETHVDQQLQSTKSSIIATFTEVKGEVKSRKGDIATLDKEKATAVQQVTDFTERQIKRLRELEKAALEEINLEHKKLSADVGSDITSLDNAISTMETDLQRLGGDNGNNKHQKFVDVKLGQSHETEGRKLLQKLRQPRRKTNLRYLLNTNMEHYLKDLDSIGTFVDNNRVCKAKLRGEYNVKIKQDKETCTLRGSCQLPDGTLMVADYINHRLKRLDASYSVKDHLQMSSKPWTVINTVPNEVAITTGTGKEVLFVSVRDKLAKTGAFRTKDCCRGICYSGGHLYVSCGGLTFGNYKEGPGHVATYDLQGTLVRTVQTDPSGQQIVPSPLHMCAVYNVTSNTECVFVADWQRGVVTLNIDGTLCGNITDKSLDYAYGLCSLNNGNFLVCGSVSNNVVQFSCDGKKVNTLLTEADGIDTPKSLCYDSYNSRLIVTFDDHNYIKVFDLL